MRGGLWNASSACGHGWARAGQGKCEETRAGDSMGAPPGHLASGEPFYDGVCLSSGWASLQTRGRGTTLRGKAWAGYMLTNKVVHEVGGAVDGGWVCWTPRHEAPETRARHLASATSTNGAGWRYFGGSRVRYVVRSTLSGLMGTSLATGGRRAGCWRRLAAD